MNTIERLLNDKRKMMVFFFILVGVTFVKEFCFPKYEAEAVVMVVLRNRVTSVEPMRLDVRENIGYIRVHQELMMSEPILRKVVEDLKLYEDEGQIRQTTEKLRKSVITTKSPPFTNLIIIKAKYKDAKKAADIANAVVRTYLDWNVRFNQREAEDVIGYLNQEVNAAEMKLRQSEEDLRAYRDKYKLVDTSEEVKFAYQQMQATADKALELELRLMRERELYTDESQQVKTLQENIDQIKGKLQNISVEGRLKDLPEKEMVLSRLQRLVVIHDASYKYLLQEREKAELIKTKQTTENIRIVSPAETPYKPKGRLMGVLTGIFLSAVLSMGLPLLWRIRKGLAG